MLSIRSFIRAAAGRMAVAGLVLLVAAPGHALADKLDAYLGDVRSMRADFVQTVSTPQAPPEESKGRIAIQRPDRFFLEYTAPYRQIYVADGARLWFYDEDLEQVTVRPQEGALGNTPAMLLSNPAQLEASFSVSEMDERNGLTWFELVPRERDSNFERVRLAFAGKELRVMEMLDNLGQTTHLRFQQVQYNRPIPAEQFRFKPPAGVDVIGG